MNEMINKAIGDRFRSPDPAKAARRQVFVFAGTVLLIVSALASDGPVSWALWAWIGYRAFVFTVLVVFGTRIVDEWNRRLSALPPAWRKWLTDGTAPA